MKIKIISGFLFVIISLIGCGPNLPFDENWSNQELNLVNQDSAKVIFPAIMKNKIGIVGYIYTNCPDICPLTTNNMRLVKEKLTEAGLDNDIQYVTVTFDPAFDTPSILKKYAELRNINTSNWQFLTGDMKTINRLMKQAGIVAAVGDSTIFPNGNKILYYVHTDRISLFDQKGHLRNYYYGSTANINQIVEDVKSLIE